MRADLRVAPPVDTRTLVSARAQITFTYLLTYLRPRLVESADGLHLICREIEIAEIEILLEPMRAAGLWQHLVGVRLGWHLARVGLGWHLVRVRPGWHLVRIRL